MGRRFEQVRRRFGGKTVPTNDPDSPHPPHFSTTPLPG